MEEVDLGKLGRRAVYIVVQWDPGDPWLRLNEEYFMLPLL